MFERIDDDLRSWIDAQPNLRENGRVCLMYASFGARPRIVRRHGTGTVLEPGEQLVDEVTPLRPGHPGTRDPSRAALASGVTGVDHRGVDTAVPVTARSRYRPGRWFLVFSLLGALLLVPVAMLSLVVPAVEAAAPVLTPGVLLLLPMRDLMSGWPGAVNLLLGSVANGLVVGAFGVVVCLLLRWRERRR